MTLSSSKMMMTMLWKCTFSYTKMCDYNDNDNDNNDDNSTLS